MKTHPLFPFAEKICSLLKTAGHEAYLVGGCVRDMLRQQAPKDLDIATSATPDIVQFILECANIEADLVGKAFGVIVAKTNQGSIEVATFRQDSPGRQPEVKFVASIEEDANRRDFTINALYFDTVEKKVLDPTGQGIEDIEDGIIRTPGNPSDRFHDDVLRVLRAIRFAHRFAYSIEESTWNAIKKNFELIDTGGTGEQIVQERVVDEFLKGLKTAVNPYGYIQDLKTTGLLTTMFSSTSLKKEFHSEYHDVCEFSEYHDGCEFIDWRFVAFDLFQYDISHETTGLPTEFCDTLALMQYVKSLALAPGNFSAKTSKLAYEKLGKTFTEMFCKKIVSLHCEELTSQLMSQSNAITQSMIQFVEQGLKADTETLMQTIKPGPELGIAVRQQEQQIFETLIKEYDNKSKAYN